MTVTERAPAGLGVAGRALWRAVAGAHDLDPVQRLLLVEVCRAKDRLDKLDAVLRGDPAVWAALSAGVDSDEPRVRVSIGSVLREADRSADVMKQLLSAMRLPNPVTGKRASRRPPRGVYRPRLA